MSAGDGGAEVARVVKGVACDVSSEEGRAALFAAAEDAFPDHVDVLVNNVGTNVRAKIEDVDDADYIRMFRTNVDSCFFLSRSFAARLARSTRAGGARIINVSSLAGLFSSGTGTHPDCWIKCQIDVFGCLMYVLCRAAQQ